MSKRLGKIAIATTTFVCATLFSLDFSGPSGIGFSTDSAQARVGRPLTPVSVAGVARRQDRRGAYGYGYGAGVVGAGLAAGAVGAATVAAATSPYGYYGQPYGYGGYANRSYVTGRPTLLPRYYGQPYGYQAAGYYASDPNAAYASGYQGAAGGYYAESPWGYHECDPATSPWLCQPYANAWQNSHY